MSETAANEPIREMRVLAWHFAFVAAGALAAFAFATPAFALSLLLGAALQTMNFRGLFGLAQAAFANEARAASGFALRLPLLGALLFFAIRAGVDAAGLLVGLSTLVPAVVVAAWQARPRAAADVSGLPALAPDDPSWDQYSPWLARERETERSEDSL
ncbi:MAG: hypothetical protein FJ091_15670 [Deltaproteobacteria bacterium]|nr:hypothetical protein [Deltaproteobacteria bacterium]